MTFQDEEVAAYIAVPLSSGNLAVAFTALPLRRRHQTISSSHEDGEDADDYESDTTAADNSHSESSASLVKRVEYMISSILALWVLYMLYFVLSLDFLVKFQQLWRPPVVPIPTPIRLTAENFTSYLAAHDNTFIHFHAPWSPCSQEMVPIWNNLQDEKRFHRDLRFMKVASVDCSQEPNLCRQQTVFSFPTLRWYYRNMLVSQVELEGHRDAEALIGFALARTNIRTRSPWGHADAFAPCTTTMETECSSLPVYSTRDGLDTVLSSLQTTFVVVTASDNSSSRFLARAWNYQDWTSRISGIPARVIVYDCLDENELCAENGIKEEDIPTMLWFNHGTFEVPDYQAGFLASEYGANGTCQPS